MYHDYGSLWYDNYAIDIIAHHYTCPVAYIGKDPAGEK